jgi:hypothetical protein
LGTNFHVKVKPSYLGTAFCVLVETLFLGTLAACSSGIASAGEDMGREIESRQGIGWLLFKKTEKLHF